MSNFRLLIASALPGAVFEFPRLCHGNGSCGSWFSASFRRMMMIFRYFSKDTPPFPHIEILAAENLVPIRRETRRALETAP